ncbi:MAG: DUF4176 domain-containing protein [Eubacterium sp.]|nr:DUF4176 domain-containing protein [Eubacterium sp.]
MEIEKKFLPIGTVVLLKGGKRELMITSYCVMPSGDGLSIRWGQSCLWKWYRWRS